VSCGLVFLENQLVDRLDGGHEQCHRTMNSGAEQCDSDDQEQLVHGPPSFRSPLGWILTRWKLRKRAVSFA
jgi:hypothetical protein